MVWFWKKSPKIEGGEGTLPQHDKKEVEKRETISLNASDNDLVRAEKICRVAGLAMTQAARDATIPWMARAIKSYQELDRELWEREKKNEVLGDSDRQGL